MKNVPDVLAERLRSRAQRNRRSLQRELLSILESAAADRTAPVALPPAPPQSLSIEEAAACARRLFPRGTASSVQFVRELRDAR